MPAAPRRRRNEAGPAMSPAAKEIRMSTGFTVRSTLDLSQVKELKRDEPLRVSLVRGERVVASRLVDLAKVKSLDGIPVEIAFELPPGERPSDLELRIGPDAPEPILPHYDALALRASPDQLAELARGGVLDLGRQAISDAIYIGWWRTCYRYTLRGRLVRRVGRCDEPVPGAVVEAQDVDRFFFWVRRTLITTATTDADGYFTMTFRWCCWRWWFYPYLGWYLDAAQWERLRELLAGLRRLVPTVPIPTGPNPPDPPLLMRLAKALDALDPASAVKPPALGRGLAGGGLVRTAAAPAPAPPPALNLAPALTPAKSPALTAEARVILAQIRELYPWWWWEGEDCYPDVLLRATQAAAGGAVILEEPFSAVRDDLRPSSSPIDLGTLLANDSAVAADTCRRDVPEGDCFKFTDVGTVQVPDIGPVSTGGPLAGFAYSGSADEPFGGTLDLFGGFGRVTVTDPTRFVDYYKLQVAPWGGNPAALPADADFADIPYQRLGHLNRQYWGVDNPAAPTRTEWVPVDLGPEPSGPALGLYRTVESFQREYEAAYGGPPGAWGWLWTSAQWIANVDTSYMPDGLHVMRLVGFRQAAGGILTPRVLLNCTLASEPQTVELLPLALDNTPLADVHVLGIDVNGVAQPSVTCQELQLKAGDRVTVHFRVQDTKNHLYDFGLAEHHRLDCAVSLLDASLAGEPAATVGVSTYAGYIAAVGAAARPNWGGGSYKVDLVVGAPPPPAAGCGDCGYDRPYFPFGGAYDIRLDAWKRVTNGYGLIFSAESNLLVVVKRTDAP
jgi:hypothetical protein